MFIILSAEEISQFFVSFSSLRFNIVTHTEGGMHLSESEDYLLDPFEQKIFVIIFPSKLGDANYAEVNAFVVE